MGCFMGKNREVGDKKKPGAKNLPAKKLLI
jgi:hypothetical protein